MSRLPIPEELRRAVLVEAGHRCAIPRCGQTELDIHHIIPWETCRKHEYDNLIALCPVCHRRAHQGEIDRKALRIYKTKLLADFGLNNGEQFNSQIIEIKRRISERDNRTPGFLFTFDFPDFKEPSERIVSRNIEALGNELLVEFRERQDNFKEIYGDAEYTIPFILRGEYRIIRRDKNVISVKYSIYQFTGGAHGGIDTRVQNFLLKPFQPVTLTELLKDDDQSIVSLSGIVRSHLNYDKNLNNEWMIRGTEAKETNFTLFNLERYGVTFTFAEYQIACYAAGEQEIFIPYDHLKQIMNPSVYLAVLYDRIDLE